MSANNISCILCIFQRRVGFLASKQINIKLIFIDEEKKRVIAASTALVRTCGPRLQRDYLLAREMMMAMHVRKHIRTDE